MNKDYLCFTEIGSGSCYGYGGTPTEAVSYMLMALPDWSDYFNLSQVIVPSTIYDVAEYDGFVANHKGVFGQLPDDPELEMRYTENPLEPHQFALSKTPKLQSKARRWSELNALRSAVKTRFYSTYDELEEARIAPLYDKERVKTPA